MNRPAKKGNVAGTVLMMQLIISGALAVFSFSAAVIYFVGMIPTVALAVQRPDAWHAKKVQVLFACNLAGVVPIVKEQFAMGAPLMGDVLASGTTYVVMYGAAGLGYAVIVIGPMVAAMVLQMMSGERLRKLAKQRQKLVDEWGPEIAQDIDVPKPQAKK